MRFKKSNRAITKSRPDRGRPVTTGIGTPVVLRMHEPQLTMLDEWIAAQDEPLSRPEAARRLIALGLANWKKTGKGEH
jgi:hypothetical protein